MRVPSHRLHKPSGRGRVTLGNRTYYTGKWGTPEAEARYRQLLAEWLPSHSQSTTVARVVSAFMRHAQREYPTNSAGHSETVNYRYALRCLDTKVDGIYLPTLPAAQFTPVRLSKVRDQMVSKGWSRTYINRQVRRIIEAFRHAAEVGLVPPEVVTALRMLKPLRQGRPGVKETPKVQAVPQEHIEAARQHMPQRIRDIVDLLLLTGMRIGEVLAMRVSNIDTSAEVWELDLGKEHKTGYRGVHQRRFFGPKARQIIAPYLEAARASHRLDAPIWPGTGQLGVLRRTGVRAEIIKACDRAGVPRWTTHQLRHNHSTDTFTREAMRLAQAALAHESQSSTAGYTESERLRHWLAQSHG